MWRAGEYHVGGLVECPQGRADETTTLDDLRVGTQLAQEVTATVVTSGNETRIGIDRDQDGALDRDELDACSDPADSPATPDYSACSVFADGFESGDTSWNAVVGN